MTEVAYSRRLAQCTCAITWCLLSGGIIFGFAALKPILIAEHVYEDSCDMDINPPSLGAMKALTSFANIQADSTAKCTNQDLKLNMIFTIAAVVTNGSALLIGRVLDTYGPKVCGLIGAAFMYLGSLVFIYAKSISLHTPFDPYLWGYASLALGGPFAFISSFQLSNAFPSNSGIVLALITGAFDASSAIFLIYKSIYYNFSRSFTIAKFFQLYLLVPTFITVAQVFVMPSESYRAPSAEATTTENTPLLADAPVDAPVAKRRDSMGNAIRQHYDEEGEEYLVEHSGGVFGVLHGLSASAQLKTHWFSLMTLFTTISMLRLNYFVATIGSQYTYMFGSVDKAQQLNHFFDIALPLGGLVSVPFVGVFLDTCSSVFVLDSTLVLSLSIGILNLFAHYVAGILNVCLFVVYRPLFYTVVSDYCAKVFGFDTFGTVYGTIITFSGIFNFGQSILDRLTHSTFKMNPLPINAILVASTAVIGFVMVTYVRVQARHFNKNKRIVQSTQ